MLCLFTWLALAGGCSSFHVRCDSHLRPINPPKTSSAAASERVKP
jgi:hypothetical protein